MESVVHKALRRNEDELCSEVCERMMQVGRLRITGTFQERQSYVMKQSQDTVDNVPKQTSYMWNSCNLIFVKVLSFLLK